MRITYLLVGLFLNTWLFGHDFPFPRVCPTLAGKSWATIIEGAHRLTPKNIDGKSSGVVNDAGLRNIFEKTIPDCGGGRSGIHLRFTQDLVPQPGKEPLGVYEVFVKALDSNEVTGFALSSSGKYIDSVPSDIAFDKHGNKAKTSVDKKITSRGGCFECHSRASFRYSTPGAEEFWSDTHSVPRLTRESDPEPKSLKRPEADGCEITCRMSDRNLIGKASGDHARCECLGYNPEVELPHTSAGGACSTECMWGDEKLACSKSCRSGRAVCVCRGKYMGATRPVCTCE